MSDPQIVILGAGPAGLGAAHRLAHSGLARAIVLEQNERVGGNAGGIEVAGMQMDFGSHRLHPTTDPMVLEDIRKLLGDDLLDRPRHGRIRLMGRWIHFPLKPQDLILNLPPAFSLGVAGDMAGKLTRSGARTNGHNTFSAAMEKGLGRTICQNFYFPYARKIWGLEPEELSVTQAKRRVSNNSLGKMVKKVLSAVPGLKPKGSGRFFYPRHGFGQISQAYCQSAEAAGAQIVLNARVSALERKAGGGWAVTYRAGEQERMVEADMVWSTIPVTVLARIISPGPTPEILEAIQNMEFRAMILVYLVLEQPQFTEYDAHYFPERAIPITRLSEQKNYRAGHGPQDKTVLCAELPCSPSDPYWDWSDEQLGQLVCNSLETAGLPVQAPVSQVLVKRLRFAYPIYRSGYEVYFERLDQWVGQIDGLLTFGRQGLFAHDNTHHALYMAYSAVDCLKPDGSFNQERWQDYRKIFETHVVED